MSMIIKRTHTLTCKGLKITTDSTHYEKYPISVD